MLICRNDLINEKIISFSTPSQNIFVSFDILSVLFDRNLFL